MARVVWVKKKTESRRNKLTEEKSVLNGGEPGGTKGFLEEDHKTKQ